MVAAEFAEHEWCGVGRERKGTWWCTTGNQIRAVRESVAAKYP